MKARPIIRALPVAGLVTVMAVFILGPATPASAVGPDLQVSRNGTGSGTVEGTGTIAGLIDCGSDCSQDVTTFSNPVTLHAIPNANSYFAGWSVSGAGLDVATLVETGDDVSFEVTSLGNTLVTATFHHIGFPACGPFPFNHCGPGTLSVAKAGTGTGTVTSTDGLISCGADCGQNYGALTQVTLIATPSAGSSFAGWSISGHGANVVGCGGLGSCTLLLNHFDPFFNFHTLVTATFNAVSQPATVTSAGLLDPACTEVGVLCGNNGSNILIGTAAANEIIGGAGNDICRGGGGADVINCGAGNDLVVGGAGNDNLTSTTGNDRINGGPGNDDLVGGPGNDTLLGGGGVDECSGGFGADTERSCET